MFCSSCGKELDSSSQFCKYCGQQLVSLAKKGNVIPFYLILFISPVVMFICKLIIWLDTVAQYPALLPKMFFNVLPITSILFIVIALLLVKFKKINPACCENYDVITWSALPLASSVYSCYESFSLMHSNTNTFVGYSLYTQIKSFFMMPLVWYYACLLLFLLIRSNQAKLGKKGFIGISVGLIVWSFALVLFRHLILRLFGAVPEILDMSSSLFCFSALLMWMRYLILLWFAYLLGQKKIGFICGTICSVGTFFVAGVATTIFMDKIMPPCIGLSESIGYVIFGLVVLIASLINKNTN